MKFISRFAGGVSVADIMDELYVQMKIEQGLEQLDTGEGVEHEEVRKKMV